MFRAGGYASVKHWNPLSIIKVPEKKSFLLRLPPELWEAVQKLAEEEFRSVNAQIEYLLRESLRARGRKVIKPHQMEDEKGESISDDRIE